MSNYSRKAHRIKAQQARKQKIADCIGRFNSRLVRYQGQLVCPYNHQDCDTLNCKGCRIYEAEKADRAFDHFVSTGGRKQNW